MAVSIKTSVPGRSEVAGNHEDHQGGCVIAAAVDRRMWCLATPQEDKTITVQSEGFTPFALNLNDPDFKQPHASESNTTRSLVRGMAAQLIERGVNIPGCHLAFESSIPVGMGLSSSAAFELCCGSALLELSRLTSQCTFELEPLDLARMSVKAENDYFGKPSGLMDQAICELGGVNYMDFSHVEDPLITPIELPSKPPSTAPLPPPQNGAKRVCHDEL